MQEFPEVKTSFLKGKDFQDTEVRLTFKDWTKNGNEDDERGTWKEKLKYMLSYTYPEWAIDPTTGERRVGKDGEEFRNQFWDEAYPHGYTIKYEFDEGTFDSGSLPLFKAFCRVRPKEGEVLVIKRTGEMKETKWFVSRASEKASVIDVDTGEELAPDQEIPF